MCGADRALIAAVRGDGKRRHHIIFGVGANPDAPPDVTGPIQPPRACHVASGDVELRCFHQRLLQRGKPGKVALVAVMRKLLLRLHAVAQRGAPWILAPSPQVA